MARHLYLLFFLSGVSGLIYEAMWSRYLRLFVGSAATAQVLVLALFMGGMSVGALLAGRRSAKISRPVLAYAIIEGLIGLYAVAFPWLYELVTRLCYDVLFPAMAGGSGIDVTITKWVAAGMLILPACILLGMTFPLMSVGILRRAPQRSGEILSLLYFTNSFGASLGAMLAGFLLVPHLGLPNTLLVAAALNLLIFAVLLRERRVDAPLDEVSAPAAASQSPLAGNRLLVPVLLLTAFGTGMSSFMYEIGWIRMLSMILGSATHSFEVMLSAFVLGLALGGLWVRKRMDRFKNPVLVLAIVQIVMGVAAVATLPLYLVANESISAVFYQPQRTYGMWVLFNVVRYLMCLLIMLPATFCAGMTLPLVTHVLLRSGQPEATVGRVYGVNTLGAIVGICGAGLVLMPVIGLKNVIVAGALVDMVLAVLIVRLLAPGAAVARIRRPVLAATVATVVMAAVGLFVIRLDPMVLAATVYRSGQTKLAASEILMHEDGRTATVTVTVDKASKSYTIMTNAKPDASVLKEHWPEGRPKQEGPEIGFDDSVQILLGLIPAMLKPNAEEWAVIGLGSGVTSHVVLASPRLKNLDIVEIEPMMARGARLLRPANERIFTDARSKLIFDDAKAHFAGARKRYDVIVSEPSNPWVSGVASLFSVEFYREVKRHLAPGGQLTQWIHGYEMSNELLLSVLAAIDREFQHYQVYRVGLFDWVIVASHDRPIGALDKTPLENWPLMTEQAELLGIRHAAQVHALLVANGRMLRPFLATVQPNSDQHPLLDTGAERARFLKQRATVLLVHRLTPVPQLAVFGGVEMISYPLVGITDQRQDRGILKEPEVAVALLRTYRAGKLLPGGEAMEHWGQATAALGNDPERWNEWGAATFAVYGLVASWVDLRETAWWRDVRAVLRRNPPPQIAEALALIDAVIYRDGPRIVRAAEIVQRQPAPRLPRDLITQMAAIGLELSRAPQATRRQFVTSQMAKFGGGDSDRDISFRITRAYINR